MCSRGACRPSMNRRGFMKTAAGGAAALAVASCLPGSAQASSTDLVDGQHIFVLKEAMHYKKLDHRRVQCQLCPKECTVDDMERGFCGVRENRGGTYYTLVHSNPCSMNVDPIEKKPLFHFLPGSRAFSIATAGCNFVCKFCQNWQISQFRPEQTENIFGPPEAIVRGAKNAGAASIAYTYSEPVVFYEYMWDTSVEAHRQGVKAVMISNGYIQLEPMRTLCAHLDAVKIDFKAYTEHFYKDVCAGTLQPVLDVLKLLRDVGIWYEMVYLVVPTLNDTEGEFRDMCRWIVDQLGPDVPLHFSRFWPQYMLKNLPPTPVETLEMARGVAIESGIHYAYIGNVPGHEGENTFCPACGKRVVERRGYMVLSVHIRDGRCTFCNHPIPGVWAS